jgi:drug/metabolite transporter (DMT)-like permease
MATTIPTAAAVTQPDRRELAIGLACAAVTVAVWTGFLLISRHGLKGTLLPWDLAALRFGVGGLVMLPWLLRFGLAGLSLGQAAVLMLTAGPLFTLIGFTAFAFAPAAHGGALMPGLLPLWTTLLAWLVLGERLGPLRAVCLALIAGGAASLFASGLTEAPPGAWIGDLIFPLAPLSWAVFTVCARRWGVAPLRAAAVVAVGSMLLYLPVYLVALPKGIPATPLAEVVVQGLFQGLVAVVVALVTYTRAVQALGAGPTTMLTAAVPGLVALLAVPLLDEPLTPLAGLGLVLVTLGMLGTVVSLRTPRPG